MEGSDLRRRALREIQLVHQTLTETRGRMVTSPFRITSRDLDRTCIQSGVAESEDMLLRCNLHNCEVNVFDSLLTRFVNCSFLDCTLVAHREFKKSLDACRWLGCHFVGDYCGVGFGSRGRYCELSAGEMVVNCDFSKANLDMCGFYEADLKTIRFPSWPNVTILRPSDHKAELQALKVPSAIQIWWDIIASDCHPLYSAKSFNWNRIVEMRKNAKFIPMDFEPATEELRQALSTLPFVIIDGGTTKFVD